LHEFEENGGVLSEARRLFEKDDEGLVKYAFTVPEVK